MAAGVLSTSCAVNILGVKKAIINIILNTISLFSSGLKFNRKGRKEKAAQRSFR
jgi:hypothetical protein